MGKQKISRRKLNQAEKPVSESKSPGNYIDAFIKRMLGQVVVFIDFLLNYADQGFVSQIDLRKISPAPTHYIATDGDERIADLIFHCPLKSGDGSLMAVIIFEHQGGDLKKIPQKLLKYISGIWSEETKAGKKVLSAPYFIVLRTGKRPHRGPLPKVADSLPKGRDGKPLGKLVEIDYDVVDLPAWDFGSLVGGPVLRLVLGMLHKMTGGHEDEFPEALLPLLEITDEEEKLELTKEILPFATKAFAAHNRRLDAETLNRALEPIFKDKERFMITTIFEEKFLEGKAEGKSEGKAEGKAEGEANIVLLLLRKKFHKVPKKLENAIRSMTDSTALESLAAHVVDCQSLDEFSDALK
jgi:hypothetical protein